MSDNQSLGIVFLPDGFRPDTSIGGLSKDMDEIYRSIKSDKYLAVYELGFKDKYADESPSFAFIHDASSAFVNSMMRCPDIEIGRENANIVISEDSIQELLQKVPFAIGAEYITSEWLNNFFDALKRQYIIQIKEWKGAVSHYIAEKSQNLRVPERIFFHLVDNKNGSLPFAFMATYATRTDDGIVRHYPLKYALTEYKDDHTKLLNLLSCLNRAAECCPIIGSFIDSGELFHPLQLTADEAWQILKSMPLIEEKSGIMCRMPNWFKRKYSKPRISIKVGKKQPSLLSLQSIVELEPELVVNGVALTQKDINYLLEQTDGLVWLKGQWIEVDRDKLKNMLAMMENYQGNAMSMLEAMRMQNHLDENQAAPEDVEISNGRWLNTVMQQLRNPSSIKETKVPKSIHASLRPYQQVGFDWLCTMAKYGFGACLADDMGLGKTLQVLTFLEEIRLKNKYARVLLVVPASLLGNWQKEAQKFAPKMPIRILHGKPAATLEKEFSDSSDFLTITTYGMATKLACLTELTWECMILDEAQAIKNPGTKQTKKIKAIPALYRIAMTGTPIENELGNLWSLFDFLNCGLLGTAAQFTKYTKKISDPSYKLGYSGLRNMIAPFILRRLKSDKNIISDLPDKIIVKDYIHLSKKQIVLYKKELKRIEEALEEQAQTGIARKGLILSSIMRLKQLCNHPEQLAGTDPDIGTFAPDDSGKYDMLREICETIYEKRERVIVFTQFKEMIKPLDSYLYQIFKIRGLMLDGSTPAKTRTKIVEQFNGDEYIPYIIISLKAGGTGLNLVSANHVIHFDRWWNPAVEEQATDRAYRIGQHKNVFVHKFICQGTVEERIDQMIESKQELAKSVIAPSSGEKWITELSNKELFDLLKLEV